MPVSKKEISPCPIDAMLSVVDGRWKGTILWRLSEGPMRTSELRRSIPGITERMLIRHLQDLVQDGILLRQRDSETPRRVLYSISEYGLTLLPSSRLSASGAASTSSAATFNSLPERVKPSPPPASGITAPERSDLRAATCHSPWRACNSAASRLRRIGRCCLR
jgi:DNA-binding HxlR family transcriptional regulator